MRRLTARILLSASACAAPALLAAPRAEAPAPAAAGSEELSRKGAERFEGSEPCAACHPAEAAQWGASLHRRTLREPAESDRQLLRRSLLCGDQQPLLVLGDRHARRFMVGSESEPGRHLLLPCRYDVPEAEWVNLHEEDWKRRSWESGCGGCHTTGFSSEDLTFRETGVGCEACHGPGSRHGGRETRGGMISFEAIGPAAEVTICASCHLQGGRSRRTGLPFPSGYRAGDDLFADFAFDWAALASADPNATGPIDRHQKILIRDAITAGRQDLRCTSCHEFHAMGHERHRALPRQEYCHLCHEQADFKLKEYAQSCNVCEF